MFESLVLCCMQPLGCVMCKKHCKYLWKNCLRSNVEAFFQPQPESNVLEIHLGCILGLSCVISGSSWGFCLAIYDFVGLILGHFGPKFGPTTYWVSWRAICWVYFVPSGHIGSFQGYVGPIGVLGHLEGYVEILEGYKAICGYFEPSVLELERSFWHQHKDLKEDVRWRDTFFYFEVLEGYVGFV